jgi:hypothetical protein
LDFVRVDLTFHKHAGYLGYYYSVYIVDVHSGYHWVRFCKTKDDAYHQLKEWVTNIERQTGRKVKVLGLDGGTEFGQSVVEFQTDKLSSWASPKGITLFKTTPHSPWMNGKIERAAGYVVTRTRTMMIALKIPERFWPFVMDSVVVVLNLLPSEANDKMASPHELLATGLNMPDEAKTPYIRHLRSYYCHAYYYIKPEKRDKAEKFIPRAKKGRLIGYGDRHGKIYWIWNEDEGKIVRASAVRFNEGPSFDGKPDPTEPEFEVVFTDPTVEEVEESLGTGIKTTITVRGREEPLQEFQRDAPDIATNKDQKEKEVLPETSRLLTPEPTPEPNERTAPEAGDDTNNAEDSLSAEEVADLAREATISPENPIAEYTTNSPAMRQSTRLEGVDDEMPDKEDKPERRASQRKRTFRFGQEGEKGLYRKLNNRQLDGQVRQLGSYFCDHLVDERFETAMEYALTAVKVDHDLHTIHTTIPKNYRQARRDPEYLTKWYPAMVKQNNSLTDKEVYILVPIKEGMDVLPCYQVNGFTMKRWIRIRANGYNERDGWSAATLIMDHGTCRMSLPQ